MRGPAPEPVHGPASGPVHGPGLRLDGGRDARQWPPALAGRARDSGECGEVVGEQGTARRGGVCAASSAVTSADSESGEPPTQDTVRDVRSAAGVDAVGDGCCPPYAGLRIAAGDAEKSGACGAVSCALSVRPSPVACDSCGVRTADAVAAVRGVPCAEAQRTASPERSPAEIARCGAANGVCGVPSAVPTTACVTAIMPRSPRTVSLTCA